MPIYWTHEPYAWQLEVLRSKARIRMVQGPPDAGKTQMACDALMAYKSAPLNALYLVADEHERQRVSQILDFGGRKQVIVGIGIGSNISNSVMNYATSESANPLTLVIDQPEVIWPNAYDFPDSILQGILAGYAKFIIVGRYLRQPDTFTGWLWDMIEKMNNPDIGQAWLAPPLEDWKRTFTFSWR